MTVFKNYENKLKRTEMRMVRWMLGVLLQEKIPSEEFQASIGIESMNE